MLQLQRNLSLWTNVIVSWQQTCKSVMIGCHWHCTLLSTLFSEISVKSNLLIHQSQANCSLVGCWKVFVIIWQIMQAVVELAKSRFIQRKCLCVFSRLWKLTSMSRNFLQNVYSQSIQNAFKTQCSDINGSWTRWIRNRNQKPFVAFTFLGDCPLSDIALSDIAFQIWQGSRMRLGVTAKLGRIWK